jgi:hypothetical protein
MQCGLQLPEADGESFVVEASAFFFHDTNAQPATKHAASD